MATVSVVYVGDRQKTMLVHRRHEYRFLVRKPIRVPSDLAAIVLKLQGGDFITEDEYLKTVEERFPRGGLVVMKRWGAIGDLIMLRAVVAAYRRRYPAFKAVIRPLTCFAAVFDHDPLWEGVWPLSLPQEKRWKFDGMVSMNQVAEADHRGVEEHRATLFAREMTRGPLMLKREDWDIPIAPEALREAETWLRRNGLTRELREKRPLVAVQVRGSGPMKSLPIQQVQALTRNLAQDCEVVLIENSPAYTWEEDHIRPFTERDVAASVAVMKACDLVICFDSGALWMAHWAGVPLLCLMGPTRPEQRISMHTGHAEAIKLNDLIECPACFEKAAACGGKYRCMQGNKTETIVELVGARARKMLAGDVPLPIAKEQLPETLAAYGGWAPRSEALP